MSRFFNGSTQNLTRADGYLAGTAPFTINLWIKPANLTQTNTYVFQLYSGTAQVGILWEYLSDCFEFFVAGHTGTDLRTGSSIALTAADLDTGIWIAYRSRGAGAEWSKWRAGVKTVINASATCAFGALSNLFVGSANGSAYFNGAIAELALWSVALTDSQMAELHAGVAADQVAPGAPLLGYWPLRGHNAPEWNYSVPAETLALTNAPTEAAHPTIVPPLLADVAASCWVVDLFHPSGTRRAATTDLSGDLDVDVLGAAYRGRLADDITIIDSDPSNFGGVMLPGQTVIKIRNGDGWLDRSWEWRQCPVRIREYDRATHALVTEFVGIVVDPSNVANSEMVFTCAGADEALLQQLVPRKVIDVADAAIGLIDDVDGATERADVGAPIPVAFGEGGVVTLAFLRRAPDSDPDGADFIAAWGQVLITSVWYDYEPNSAGLELALVWAAGPGTPTTATTTTFTVTGDQSLIYTVGTPVRRSGDSGATWAYSEVTGYSSGTVTVAHAILPGSGAMGLLQIGGEFIVERDRYKYVGDNTTFLTTLRFLSDGPIGTAVLAAVINPNLTNPADVIKFLLEDPDQGLGQGCDASSFTGAQTAFVAAGLATAVNGTVGGDRTQRRALDVLNELAAMRGAVLWRDPESLQWMIQVDTAPPVSTRTLEFGADLKNDIAEVLSVSRTPLAQAINALVLRYAPGGRTRGNKSFVQQDYAYRARMTVLSGIAGTEQTIESQFLRDHMDAKRVLYYRGKRLQRGDEQIRFRMMRGGRRVRRGEVFAFTIPTAGVSGNYRIIARERQLNEFVFTAVGPYNADIYATDEATINAATSAPSTEAAVDEVPNRGGGMNLVLNADFSAELTHSMPIDVIDGVTLPEWVFVFNSAPPLASLQIVADPRAKGLHYLEIGLAAGQPVVTTDCLELQASGSSVGAVPVLPGTAYLASAYIDSSASGGRGWRFEVSWLDSGFTERRRDIAGTLLRAPGDLNSFGWQRSYGVLRVPRDLGITYGFMVIRLFASSATFKIDAVQFEQLSNIFVRPTEWTRNPTYGLQPANLRSGDITVRAQGEPEHGTALRAQLGITAGSGGVTLSGTSTVLGSAGPGLVTGITARVTTAVTGPASWQLALDYGGGDRLILATGIANTAGTTVGDGQMQSMPIFLNSAVDIVALPASGSFTGGKVKVTAHGMSHIPPTS